MYAEPFRIDIREAVLADLRERLARTRWPIEPQSAPWQHGTSLAWMREVVEHWLLGARRTAGLVKQARRARGVSVPSPGAGRG